MCLAWTRQCATTRNPSDHRPGRAWAGQMIAFRTSYSALTCLQRPDGDHSVLTVPGSGTTRQTGRVATRGSARTRNPNRSGGQNKPVPINHSCASWFSIVPRQPCCGQPAAAPGPTRPTSTSSLRGCRRVPARAGRAVNLRRPPYPCRNSGKHSGLRIRMHSSKARTSACAGVGLPNRASVAGRRGIGSHQRCVRPAPPSSRGARYCRTILVGSGRGR
jgi:hypothetical protein